MNSNVILMVVFGSDKEAEAIRSSLEWFGATIITKYIGRPFHFIEVLRGEYLVKPEYILLVGHGDRNGFVMPEISIDLYLEEEPRKYIRVEDVHNNIKISNTCIISTACLSGMYEMADAFKTTGNTYIAPVDYIDGSADLIFVVRLFYEIITNNKSIIDAFNIASNIDLETLSYKIRY